MKEIIDIFFDILFGGPECISAIGITTALLAAAGIGAASGIGGSVLNNAQSNLNYQQQLALMREQNQWNSPVEQMKRFSEAGLNPNLIYSQGVSGAAGNTSVITPQKTDVDWHSALRGSAEQLMNGLLQAAQVRKVSAEAAGAEAANSVFMDKYETEKKLFLAQLLNYGDKHNLDKQLFDFRSMSTPYQLESQQLANQTARFHLSQTLPLSVQNTLAEIQQKVAQKKFTEKNTKFLQSKINELNTLLPLQVTDYQTKWADMNNNYKLRLDAYNHQAAFDWSNLEFKKEQADINQIFREKSFVERVRQFDKSLAFKIEQYNAAVIRKDWEQVSELGKEVIPMALKFIK